MVQWLKFCASTAGGVGSIPSQRSSACWVVLPKKKKAMTQVRDKETEDKSLWNGTWHLRLQEIVISPEYSFKTHVSTTWFLNTYKHACRVGNGNPLQYSCLENPKDRGAWRAAVHGVTKSRTRLKQLSTQACLLTLHTHTHTHRSKSWASKLIALDLIMSTAKQYVLQSEQKCVFKWSLNDHWKYSNRANTGGTDGKVVIVTGKEDDAQNKKLSGSTLLFGATMRHVLSSRVLVPWPGIKLTLPAVEARNLNGQAAFFVWGS